MKRLVIVSFMLTLASVQAIAASSVCDDLAKAVEDGVKEMAYYDDAALGTSGVEVTSRKLNLIAETSRVQSNLLLMQANKCSMPKEPIDPRAYFHSAFACVHATPKPGNDPIKECDRAKWARAGSDKK